MKHYDAFETRIVDLMRVAESMSEEHAPHRYIRQLVRSQGLEFYIYQGSFTSSYSDEPPKKDSYVKDLDGNILGKVDSDIYWELVREFKERETNKSLNKLMGVK